MSQIIAYLKFKEKCRAAMNFYQSCLGGELTFKTVKGSVFESPGMSEAEGGKIVHAQLVNDRIILYASEMAVPDSCPNSTFLWVNCDTDEEIRRIHTGLSKNGKVTAELQQAYWGTIFGGVEDQFGISWYISRLPLDY